MAGRTKTRFPGVYTRTAERRRHEGRADVAFDITYKVGSRKVWEKVGWKSEGVTAAYAAQVRNDRVMESRATGGPVKACVPMSLNEAFEVYRATHLVNTKSEARIVNMYEVGVAPTFGARLLHQITSREVQAFVTGLRGKRAPATIRHYVGILRAVYNKLSAWGEYRGGLPTLGVVIPSVDNERTRFLTEREASMLLDELCCRSLDTYRLALVSLHTGMRASEIFAMRGEDVDLSAGIIRVRGKQGEEATRSTKGGHSRTAYMSETVRKTFEALDLRPGELVFPARGGGVRRWVPATFDRAVEELGLNEGLEDARDKFVFHSLRHTFAAWLVSKGVPLYTVSQLLGHSTIKMTERYSHLAPDAKRQALDVLNAIA